MVKVGEELVVAKGVLQQGGRLGMQQAFSIMASNAWSIGKRRCDASLQERGGEKGKGGKRDRKLAGYGNGDRTADEI